MFQSIFSLPGMGFFAYGNAISNMQLLTPICQVLLTEEATVTFGAREAACIYSVGLLSWARYFLTGRVCRNMSSKLKGWKGLGKGWPLSRTCATITKAAR